MVAVCSCAHGAVVSLLHRLIGVAAGGHDCRLQVFGLLWLFIASVSVHDAALVVLNREAIMYFEQNPLGRWLIDLAAGSVWLFVAVKLLGTSVVCGLLAGIHESSRSIGLAVIVPLACFQAGLLTYLYTH